MFVNGDRFGFTFRSLKLNVFKEDLFLKEMFSPKTLYDWSFFQGCGPSYNISWALRRITGLAFTAHLRNWFLKNTFSEVWFLEFKIKSRFGANVAQLWRCTPYFGDVRQLRKRRFKLVQLNAFWNIWNFKVISFSFIMNTFSGWPNSLFWIYFLLWLAQLTHWKGLPRTAHNNGLTAALLSVAWPVFWKIS